MKFTLATLFFFGSTALPLATASPLPPPTKLTISLMTDWEDGIINYADGKDYDISDPYAFRNEVDDGQGNLVKLQRVADLRFTELDTATAWKISATRKAWGQDVVRNCLIKFKEQELQFIKMYIKLLEDDKFVSTQDAVSIDCWNEDVKSVGASSINEGPDTFPVCMMTTWKEGTVRWKENEQDKEYTIDASEPYDFEQFKVKYQAVGELHLSKSETRDFEFHITRDAWTKGTSFAYQCRVTVNKEGHVEDDFIKLGDDAKVGPAFDGLKTTCYKVLSGASASGPHG